MTDDEAARAAESYLMGRHMRRPHSVYRGMVNYWCGRTGPANKPYLDSEDPSHLQLCRDCLAAYEQS